MRRKGAALHRVTVRLPEGMGEALKRAKPLSRKALLVVLEVIEQIVGDDSCTTWDLENANKRFRGEKLQMLNKLLAVYRLAHSANETHSCFQVHEDWRKEGRERGTP